MLKRLVPSTLWGACFLLLTGFVLTASAQDQSIYTDSLQNGWANWSWNDTFNPSATAYVHSGTYSISVTLSNYGALYLHHNAQNSSQFSAITFWINGGASGGQSIQVQATRNGAVQTNKPLVVLAPLPAGNWRQDTVSLSSLDVANVTDFDGFWLQVQNSGVAPAFYVDDMVLTTNPNPPAVVTLTSPANGSTYQALATINLSASVTTNGHTINNVQFFNGSTLLGQDTSAPYNFTWNNVPAATYTLTAQVVFDSGSASAGTNISAPVTVTVVTNTPVSIAIDAQQNRHSISPLIYGTAFATSNQISDLNFTMNRSGGNEETTYNWLINAHGKGNDWYFESMPDDSATPGESADSFVANSKYGGAAPLITLPIIGWAPKLGPGRGIIWSYSVSKYGPQKASDPYRTDAGNGISSTNGGKAITWNDPNDAYFPTNLAFTQGYMQHLMSQWGNSTNGGVPYYILDNEHSIWFSTHQDIHPVGATMQEIWGKMLANASMVKSNDPNALVLGPEEWGWGGYFYSGYDQQNSGFGDRATNGGWDYMPWLLNQFHQHDTSTGQRLLDYFTLHCYPQENNSIVGTDDISPSTVALRNQSTRQFWDTNYVDPSWINSIIMLIPRMKNWVSTYYPGTKTGVTEYNWGAETNISGATAQADILGIFGREGLDLATRWMTPNTGTPTYNAMKLYRNYDGNKSTFGDTSVLATGPNPDNVAVFAAIRSSDSALTAMVINKQIVINATVSLTISNFVATGTAHVWQLNATNIITHLPDLTLSGNILSTTVPAQSITLFVLPAAAPAAPTLIAGNVSPTNTFDFWLNGQTGQTYALLWSTNLLNWVPFQTNTLASNSLHIVVSTSNSPARLFRAQWVP
jgi:hypothetical protein